MIVKDLLKQNYPINTTVDLHVANLTGKIVSVQTAQTELAIIYRSSTEPIISTDYVFNGKVLLMYNQDGSVYDVAKGMLDTYISNIKVPNKTPELDKLMNDLKLK